MRRVARLTSPLYRQLGVEIVAQVSPTPTVNPCPPSSETDRGMIGIRGFPPYGKHASRLQASSLCGRKPPRIRRLLYQARAADALRSILISSPARATSDFTAGLRLSRDARGDRVRGVGLGERECILRVRKSSCVIDLSISRERGVSATGTARWT